MFRFHDPAQPEDRLFISTALTFQGGGMGGRVGWALWLLIVSARTGLTEHDLAYT